MSDSSIPASADRSPLESGLSALRRKDYSTAIARLIEVCQTEQDRATLAQAQMALVKAYRRSGDLSQARSLCETLSHSHSRKVRAWAAENLAQIDSLEVDQTGFVPLTTLPTGAEREQIVPTVPTVPTAESIASDSFENPFQLVEPAAIAAEPVSEPAAETGLVELPAQPRSTARSQKWTSLGTGDLSLFAALQVGTTIATVYLVYGVVWLTLTWINDRLEVTIWPFDLRWMAIFYGLSIWPTIFVLSLLMAIAPWLIDTFLQRFYSLKPFSLTELERYSPEASRLLKRGCSTLR